MVKKYIRFVYEKQIRFGIHEGELVRLLSGESLETLRDCGETIPFSRIEKLLPPFHAGKILGIGRNYMRPEFTEADIPKVPKVFLKSAESIIQEDEEIVLTPMNRDVICEPEIAFMIGKGGSRIHRERAMEHVGGYLVINDVTDRALLKEDGGEWTRGKSQDTFLPMGSAVIAGIDPFHLEVSCEINGKKQTEGNTADMIFDIPELVSFISHFMRLDAGDIILTGTPRGVTIRDGDRVKICVEQVGELENTVRYDDSNWNLA